MPSTIPPSQLELGWVVTSDSHPKYWMDKGARAGGQSASDLVCVSAETMATHSIVFAKSGSGKSFFLGRLIEEIILNTKAKCLILDPNADFRRIYKIEKSSLWSKRNPYRIKDYAGALPTESTKSEFASRWTSRSRSKVIMTRRLEPGKNFKQLLISWPSVPYEFIADQVEPNQRIGIYYCHRFVAAISFLTSELPNRNLNFISESEKLLKSSRSPKPPLREVLEDQFQRPILKDIKAEDEENFLPELVEQYIDQAVQAAKYITPQSKYSYFAKAREYEATGILADKRLPATRLNARITVLDLPSVKVKQLRLLAVGTILSRIREDARLSWQRALRKAPEKDHRVPTFIVVDEAHNLMPAQPEDKIEEVVRDHFRTIAAEGRKYGLFLVIVTQRADKIDPFVISECENKAVMQIDRGVLESLREMFGASESLIFEKCASLKPGRVLLTGRWSPDPRISYVAARRTREGGRNLRSEFWAHSEEREHEIRLESLRAKREAKSPG